jgi:alkylmercury lyase
LLRGLHRKDIRNPAPSETTGGPSEVSKAEEFNLDKLAASVLGAFPKLDALDQRLSLELYRMLAEGRPVSRGSLAQRLEISDETVERILDGWPGVFFDPDRRVVGYWGLSLPSTYCGPHRLTIDCRSLSTWCAWDTLFLPQLLGRAAEVETVSPNERAPVRLTVTPERVERVDPRDASMSFLLPDPATVQKDVVTSFCHFVHFFPSRRAGENWALHHPGTFILSIEAAYALGRRKNAAQYRDALALTC